VQVRLRSRVILSFEVLRVLFFKEHFVKVIFVQTWLGLLNKRVFLEFGNLINLTGLLLGCQEVLRSENINLEVSRQRDIPFWQGDLLLWQLLYFYWTEKLNLFMGCLRLLCFYILC
jgi:hypothetical protein